MDEKSRRLTQEAEASGIRLALWEENPDCGEVTSITISAVGRSIESIRAHVRALLEKEPCITSPAAFIAAFEEVTGAHITAFSADALHERLP